MVTKAKPVSKLRKYITLAHKFLKDTKLISKGLTHFGHHKLSAHASLLGYGKRRRLRGGNGGLEDRMQSMADRFNRGSKVKPPRHYPMRPVPAPPSRMMPVAQPVPPGRSLLGRVHDHIKKNRYVSRGLTHFGYKKLGAISHLAGYGKSRRKRGGNLFGSKGLRGLLDSIPKPKKKGGGRRRMRGGSFFGNIGNAFKKAGSWVKGAAGSVNGFLKKYKPISRLGSLVPYAPVKAGATVAGLLGYGKSRKRRGGRRPKRMRGRGRLVGTQYGGSRRSSGPCMF